MCNWGEDGPWNFATVSTQYIKIGLQLLIHFQTIANSWRISGDIMDVRHFLPSLNARQPLAYDMINLTEFRSFRRPLPLYVNHRLQAARVP